MGVNFFREWVKNTRHTIDYEKCRQEGILKSVRFYSERAEQAQAHNADDEALFHIRIAAAFRDLVHASEAVEDALLDLESYYEDRANRWR